MSFPTSHEAESSLELLQHCRQFTLSEIKLATKNFKKSLVIGSGGFGKVYKGTVINGSGGLAVAIKRLESTSNQGAVEFRAEVEMLTKLRHCHLVSLIGYCKDGHEMILVYEYMPRGTLEDHLHTDHTRLNSLPWVTRLKICIGAARGLDYLHTGTGINHGVIHRDVKSSNILLHKSWAAKISDFGLSKTVPTNLPSTYVNTLVKGTFGYLDPNYFNTGRLTRKSDVYAFGVVLFEVLCRKRAVDNTLDEEQWGLASWAQDSIKEGRLKEIIDTSIKREVSFKCLKEFAQLADRCLHSHPKKRPTMAEVVVGLEFVLALQENANKTTQPSGMTIFGRKVPTFLFSSNGESSGGSLKSLESFFDDLGDDYKVLYRFDFETINIATNYFSEETRLMEASHVYIYKGRLQNGQKIAITRHFSDLDRCFIEEVEILVQIEHENLLDLLGYCIKGTEVLIVYDFAPYASLHYLLFDPTCTLLDWDERYNILLGVAKVLVYLHDIQIVHCDVTCKNILLDVSLNPKFSSFSRVRLLPPLFESSEYAEHLSRELSYKVDVFSFGVLVLELISGTIQNRHRIWKSWQDGTSANIIDPRINVDSRSMTRLIHIVLLCIQEDPIDRPTMQEVLDMLLGNSSQ